MDHRLAIVIVPRDSKEPVHASSVLLERFQKVPLTSVTCHFEQKFRFKRVGGWFDGLVSGRVGQERWSTVLRMLLDGAPTSAKAPLIGFGPETGAEIESRIEADNTIDLDDIWPLAPSSVIVTPDGEWLAHPNPDYLDRTAAPTEVALAEANEAWARTKRALFWEHRGSTAVAWDISWHFMGMPAETKTIHKRSIARPLGRKATRS